MWREDSASTRYPDAWAALDGISITTFTNNFERNVSTQSSFISTVEKTSIGTQKAIKVDYVLTDTAKKASVRIRSFFILRKGHWYSISCATLESQPDLFLDAMLKAAGTFEPCLIDNAFLLMFGSCAAFGEPTDMGGTDFPEDRKRR